MMRPSSALGTRQQQSRPGSAKPNARPGSAMYRKQSSSNQDGSNNDTSFSANNNSNTNTSMSNNNNNNPSNFVNVMNNSERVHVAVRIRPYLPRCDTTSTINNHQEDSSSITNPSSEQSSSSNNHNHQISTIASGSSVVLVKAHLERERAFEFDHVIDGGQEQLYEAIGQPLLKEVLSGFNSCAFAYGQTGAGKSYSLLGPTSSTADDSSSSSFFSDPFQQGLLPRLVDELFKKLQDKMDEDPHLGVKVGLSAMEIYMEKVRDLLAFRPPPPLPKNYEPENLDLQDDGGRKVKVKGLGVHQVLSADRVKELLAKALCNRQTAETKMNEASSRSHLIVQLTITQFSDSSNEGGRDVESVMTIVDLAGSERQTKSGTSGLTLEEGKTINLSLLTLGRALHSLSQGNRDVVSLRDSKLTRLLGESLGGNSKTWMLATVAAASCHLQETLSTLDYATHARAISNSGVHINQFKVSMVESTKIKLVESIRNKMQTKSKDEMKLIEVSEFRDRLRLGAESFEKLVEVAKKMMKKMFSGSSSSTDEDENMHHQHAIDDSNEEEDSEKSHEWSFVVSQSRFFSPTRQSRKVNKTCRIEVEYGSDFSFCSSCKKAPAIECSVSVEKDSSSNNNNDKENSSSHQPPSSSSSQISGGDTSGSDIDQHQVENREMAMLNNNNNKTPMRLDVRILNADHLPKMITKNINKNINNNKVMYLELYSRVENGDEENHHHNGEEEELCLGAVELRVGDESLLTNINNCEDCVNVSINFQKTLYFSKGMGRQEVIVVKLREC